MLTCENRISEFRRRLTKRCEIEKQLKETQLRKASIWSRVRLKSSNLLRRAAWSKLRALNSTTSRCIKERSTWWADLSIEIRRNEEFQYLILDWYLFWIAWAIRLEMSSSTTSEAELHWLNWLNWLNELNCFFWTVWIRDCFLWTTRMLDCFLQADWELNDFL